MNAKGKVSSEEFQQLVQRGMNAWQMLADGMGMTQGEVRKLSWDGKLLAKDALPLIYEGMQKTFGGGTQNLTKSTTGQCSGKVLNLCYVELFGSSGVWSRFSFR
ncbi:tape measure protein [Rossellomorea marisflavi]|uniref:tape measure protein n=1 Tax=Rossellomorea marisflavi TaxID=189381 RepID=UPI00203C070B|nr:tape measure protein [Rossellomorea marisflavi]MCM2590480.1 tape measure protein [Rossellomorea marisflavi]